MTNKRLALVSGLGMISVLAAACTFSFSSARIADATMAKGVSDKMEAIDPTSIFDTTDNVVHCLVVLANAPEKTKVKAIWTVVNAEGQKPNATFGETTVEGGGTKNAVDFTYTPPPAGIPIGEYKVDIYLNPEPGKESQPTKTVLFSVKSSGPIITGATLSDSENGESMTEFPADSRVFYCRVELRGAAAGMKLSASWVAVEARATAPNYAIGTTPIVLEAGQNRVNYHLKYDSGFPPGRYRVDIFVGDSTTAAKSVTFTVAE